MRLHTEHTEEYIRVLAASIAKDPASLQEWRCAHLHAKGLPMPAVMQALPRIKELHGAHDCDVVTCAQEDIFLISRELDADGLRALGKEILSHNGTQEGLEISLYDLFRDWRQIRELLLEKAPEPALPAKTVMPENEPFSRFGEVDSLRDIFSEVQQRRSARNPLHIMVVEDDPLTRRILSNILKDQYAMITAKDAHEAIMNYLLYAPDMVFLDIGLPDESGFEVLKQIMQCDPKAYVVMASSNSYLDNVTFALSQGASGFVAKPFRHEKLRSYIVDCALHHHKAHA